MGIGILVWAKERLLKEMLQIMVNAVVVSDAVVASAHGALCAASAAPQAEFCVMFQGAKERET